MNEGDPGPTTAGTHPVDVHLAHRIWLQDGDTPVFGVGICELLGRVEATGSLRHAASDMGMAYSKAWQIVRRAEAHLGFPLLTRQTGGEGGGGSVLSDEARWLVRAFGALLDEVRPMLDELYAKHFGQWTPESAAPTGNEPGIARAAPLAGDSGRTRHGGYET